MGTVTWIMPCTFCVSKGQPWDGTASFAPNTYTVCKKLGSLDCDYNVNGSQVIIKSGRHKTKNTAGCFNYISNDVQLQDRETLGLLSEGGVPEELNFAIKPKLQIIPSERVIKKGDEALKGKT